MTDNKKKNAAIAAVMYYLNEEEAAMIQQQAAMGEMPQVPAASLPQAAVNLWGMNGRQTQMQMRNLMQMRTFR